MTKEFNVQIWYGHDTLKDADYDGIADGFQLRRAVGRALKASGLGKSKEVVIHAKLVP